jgi:hypothetical protein
MEVAMRSMKLAQKRYAWRVAGFMAAYVVTLIAVIYLFRSRPPTGALAYAAAALPALPIIGVFWAIGRLLVEEEDEYQRMLLVKQTLLGTALTLALATIFQFLEGFALVTRPRELGVAVLWFAMWGISAAIVRMRA